jgi:hypothetical protein
MSTLIRRTAFYLALAGMELSLWGLFIQLLGAHSGPAPVSLIWMSSFLLLAIVVNAYLPTGDLDEGSVARWSSGFGLLCALGFAWLNAYGPGKLPGSIWLTVRDILAAGFGEFRPALGLFMLGLVLWWRGSALVRMPRTFQDVAFHFRLGVIVLLVLLMLRVTVPTPHPRASLVLYFAASLLALGLIRAEEMLRVPGGTPLTLGPKWSAWLFGATAVTIALGLLAAWAVSFSTLRALLIWMSPVLQPIVLVAYEVFLRFAKLLDPLMQWLTTWLQRYYQRPAPTPSLPPSLGEMGAAPPAAQWPAWVFPLLNAFRWIGIAVVGILILLLLTQILAQQRQSIAGDTAGGQRDALPRSEGESSPEGQHLADRLAAAIAAAVRRWRQPQTPAERVRWLYARLLRLGAERNMPRPPYATPYDHENTLRRAFAGHEEEIRVLTQAYVRAHYAESQIDEATLERVEQAWKRIRSGR